MSVWSGRYRVEVTRSFVLALSLLAGCGRAGFDPLGNRNGNGNDNGNSNGNAHSLVIASVTPEWSMPAGCKIDVAIVGDLVGVTITIDGISCDAPTMVAPDTVRCMAPAHIPAVVQIVATNAAGDTGQFARFSYVTPGTYQLGGALEDWTSGVAIDADGSVYLSGGTTGSLSTPNLGDYDALLIKYDASGTLAWIRQLGTPLYDYARDVAVDPSGNVTIVGHGSGDIDADGVVEGSDIFVARYSPAGDLLWVTQTEAPGNDESWDLGVDAAANVVVAGQTDGTFTGTVNAGGLDYAVLRYTAAGTLDWVRQDGTSADDDGHSVAVSADGTAFLVGYTGSALETGNANAGGLDLFVARYEVDGTRSWIHQRGTATDDAAQDITIDRAGDLWIAGYSQGSLDGNPSGGGRDAFAMSYTAAGSWLLTRMFGGTGNENSWGIAVAPDGPVYLSCVTTAAFDGQSYAGGSQDFCMIALDRDGGRRWTRVAGTTGRDMSSSCALDTDHTGLVYISLITDGALDGGANRGGNDVAVAKIDASGMWW